MLEIIWYGQWFMYCHYPEHADTEICYRWCAVGVANLVGNAVLSLPGPGSGESGNAFCVAVATRLRLVWGSLHKVA